MAYQAGKGISRALLIAYRDLIRANISGLNAALYANDETRFITTETGVGEILTQHVIIGRTRQLWTPMAVSPKGGGIRICICNTDYRNANSFTSTPNTVETYGVSYEYQFNNSIFVYIHPDMVRFEKQPELTVYSEEMVLSTIEDWFRGSLFASFNNQVLALESNEFDNTPANHDSAVEVMVTSAYQGYFETAFEEATTCAGLHLLMSSKVY